MAYTVMPINKWHVVGDEIIETKYLIGDKIERVFSVLKTRAGISNVIKQLEKHLEKKIVIFHLMFQAHQKISRYDMAK